MEAIIFLIAAATLISIIGTIIWWVAIFLTAKAAVTHIAKSVNEFQQMDVNGMYRTLLHLQQNGQFQIGRQYMNSVEGPVTSEIRFMAASEGIQLNF